MEPSVGLSCNHELAQCADWSLIQKLEFEKSVLGFFLSGHPLSEEKHIIELFTNINSKLFADPDFVIVGNLQALGIVANVMTKRDKKGKPFADRKSVV